MSELKVEADCGCEYYIDVFYDYDYGQIGIDGISIHKYCDTHSPVRAINPRLKEAVEVIKNIRDGITATTENEEGYLSGIGMCLCELYDRIQELEDDK